MIFSFPFATNGSVSKAETRQFILMVAAGLSVAVLSPVFISWVKSLGNQNGQN